MDAVYTLLNPSGTAGRSEQSLRTRAIALLDGIVFGGMLAVIALTAIPYGTVQPWWIAVFECGVFALGALWIIQGSLARHWQPTNGILLAPPAGLLLFAFVQSLAVLSSSGDIGSRTLSADPFQTRLWVLHFGALLMAAIILFSHTSNLRRLRYLVNVIIAIGVASAMFGLLRQAIHFDLPVQDLLPPAAQGTYGQFINRNHFALLIEMSLGLVSGLIVSGGMRRAYLVLYLAATVLLWVALVLANSRGGILAMLGQSLFLALFWNTARKQVESKTSGGRSRWTQKPIVKRALRAVLAVGLVTIVIVGVVWVGGDALRHRFEVLPRELSAESSTRENSSRLAIWKATIAMIQDNPVVGVGFGGYRISLPRYHDASGHWIPQEAHNDYLELIASGGIIAAVLAVLFFAVLSRTAWRCLNASTDRFRKASCFGALVGLVGAVIHSFVDFGLHTTGNAVVCITLVVIATRTFAAEKDTSQTRSRASVKFDHPAPHPALSKMSGNFLRLTQHQRAFFLRLIVTVGGLVICLLGMTSAARAGLSRYLSEEALATRQINSANQAVQLEPSDPEAFYARGLLLSGSSDFEAAIDSFKQSIRLRPRDGSAWLRLGVAYESHGESARALEAYSEAVRLAPYYAEPHWYRGTGLLKSGRVEEAFAELRIAVQSEPSKLPEAIELAWGAHGGVTEKVLQAVRPQTDAARISLASFFIKKNQMQEAVELLRAAGPRANFDRYRFMVGLIEAHHYRDAADVLNSGAGSIKEGLIDDADFEHGGLSRDIGFAWQIPQQPGTTNVAVDQNCARSGSRSLRLIFNGVASSESEFVKQLVLAEPRTRYGLSFAARTEDLHSDGQLLLSVVEAGLDGRLLGVSQPVTKGTADWHDYTVEFETANQTQAVYIVIQPRKCESNTCSVSGRAWFDTFSLRKL